MVLISILKTHNDLVSVNLPQACHFWTCRLFLVNQTATCLSQSFPFYGTWDKRTLKQEFSTGSNFLVRTWNFWFFLPRPLYFDSICHSLFFKLLRPHQHFPLLRFLKAIYNTHQKRKSVKCLKCGLGGLKKGEWWIWSRWGGLGGKNQKFHVRARKDDPIQNPFV